MNTLEKTMLLDENRGIYIPKQFAKQYAHKGFNLTGITEEQIDILLEGHNHEHYWEVWDEVLSTTTLVLNGVKHTLEQDGDLWAIPEGYEEKD